LAAVNAEGTFAAASHKNALGHFVFWTLAEMCAEYRLPFDLMIGVNRGVYEAGVQQGRDLYDSRVSLIQYKELFNAFPQVTFPISVLASVTNQELTSYAWIFPNVVTNGHWWYSNTPTFIEHDLAARLEAVPRTKQIAYYSDMYKLEFALPKFGMFKRILAKVLAERFVIDRNWSEEQAVELGVQVLRGNTERIFRWGEDLHGEMPVEAVKKTYFIEPMSPSVTAATGSVLLPHDRIRIEPPKEDSPVEATEEIELGMMEEDPTPVDQARMTMLPPSREEIAAAAQELDAEHLELIDEPAPAAAESGLSLEELALEELEAPEAQETFSVRQTEPISQAGQDAQPDQAPQEPSAEEPAADEPAAGSSDWDFLDTRKK
jgi:hypothetical protein